RTLPLDLRRAGAGPRHRATAGRDARAALAASHGAVAIRTPAVSGPRRRAGRGVDAHVLDLRRLHARVGVLGRTAPMARLRGAVLELSLRRRDGRTVHRAHDQASRPALDRRYDSNYFSYDRRRLSVDV